MAAVELQPASMCEFAQVAPETDSFAMKKTSFAASVFDAPTLDSLSQGTSEDLHSTDECSSGEETLSSSTADDSDTGKTNSSVFGFRRVATPPIRSAPGLSLLDMDSDEDNASSTSAADEAVTDEDTDLELSDRGVLALRRIASGRVPLQRHGARGNNQEQLLIQGRQTAVEDEDDSVLSEAAVLALRRVASGNKLVNLDEDDLDLSEAAKLALRRVALGRVPVRGAHRSNVCAALDRESYHTMGVADEDEDMELSEAAVLELHRIASGRMPTCDSQCSTSCSEYGQKMSHGEESVAEDEEDDKLSASAIQALRRVACGRAIEQEQLCLQGREIVDRE